MEHGRIKGLDGLRAIAVLIVFGMHTSIPGIGGGGIGVDIFFVLSGYLITRNLAREIAETGQISILDFYLRRILRLWPVLISVCLVFSFSNRVSLTEEIIPSIFYYSNWTRSWFDYPRIFGHTWSLAVEEQFYLLWPWLLLIILSSRHATIIILMIALIACAWRYSLYVEGTSMMRLFNGFDTRCDALMIGSALALASPSATKQIANIWPIALIFFLWALVYETWESPWLYYIGFTALAVMSASIIAKVSTEQTGWLTRSLEWKPLSGLGVISYGFYMWHYPIVFLTDNRFGIFESAIFCFVITLLCAVISWFMLEKPILLARKRAIPKLLSIR